MRYLLVALLFLGGCSTYQDRIRTVGGQAFEEVESSSALVLDGAIRYMCKTARINAIMAKFSSPDLREAWATICEDRPELPE